MKCTWVWGLGEDVSSFQLWGLVARREERIHLFIRSQYGVAESVLGIPI